MKPRTRRRVVAVVLPELACELAREPLDDEPPPFAVIVDDDAHDGEIPAGAVLHAVDPRAWSFGARPGQTAAQASAYVGGLEVRRVSRREVHEALGTVAEVVLRFGTTAGLELRDAAPPLRSPVKRSEQRQRDAHAAARYPAGAGAGPFDTVWLDVTGCARLVGGEDVLLGELAEAVAALGASSSSGHSFSSGHRVRLAIADGPRIAQAVARWAPSPRAAGHVVPPGEGAAALAPLPIAALPLPTSLLGWFGKLGVFHVGDLARLEPAKLSHRLGPGARELLALVAGHDLNPLVAYEAPRRVVEQACFDDELEGLEPLLFVLRGLCARAAARLEARGEACSQAAIHLAFDPSVTRLLRRNAAARRDEGLALPGASLALPGVSLDTSSPPPSDEMGLSLDLVVPLAGEAELFGAFRAKLESVQCAAPLRGVRIELDELVPRRQHQLGLGASGPRSDPDAFPLLLAELGAWLGADRVGRLQRIDAHCPEDRTAFVAPLAEGKSPSLIPSGLPQPCRLLPAPVDIGPLRPDGLAMIEGRLFVIDGYRLVERLDGVAWWRPVAGGEVRRDYYRVRLHRPLGEASSRPAALDEPAGDEHVEALVYLDRQRSDRRAWLQGWYDG